MFVEIHTVGQDDWTTLADDNEHTSDDTGLSCPSARPTARTGSPTTRSWRTTRPRSTTATTATRPAPAAPGTPPRATRAAGRSGPCRFPRRTPARTSRSRSRSSAIRRSWASAPGSTSCSLVDSGGNPINSADPSFETGHGRLDAARPARSRRRRRPVAATGWERAQSAPFVETPITTTDDTVYTGFGFEAVHRRGEPRRR